jgi:hypothetical protein
MEPQEAPPPLATDLRAAQAALGGNCLSADEQRTRIAAARRWLDAAQAAPSPAERLGLAYAASCAVAVVDTAEAQELDVASEAVLREALEELFGSRGLRVFHSELFPAPRR